MQEIVKAVRISKRRFSWQSARDVLFRRRSKGLSPLRTYRGCAVQNRFVEYALMNKKMLRMVLRKSADEQQRAIAAQIWPMSMTSSPW